MKTSKIGGGVILECSYPKFRADHRQSFKSSIRISNSGCWGGGDSRLVISEVFKSTRRSFNSGGHPGLVIPEASKYCMRSSNSGSSGVRGGIMESKMGGRSWIFGNFSATNCQPAGTFASQILPSVALSIN